MKKVKVLIAKLQVLLLFPGALLAQAPASNPASLTLEQCIEYALKNQPVVRQSLIDEAIGEREIKANLSGWLPQVNATYGIGHNILLQQIVVGDNVIRAGMNFDSNILLQASQTLYNNDLALASRAARVSRLQLDQNIENVKINTVVNVSKSFYSILLTQEQLHILDENIARQEKQYRDARSQYESGVVDKTDYQRASITLANSRSDKKRTQESLKAQYALLKQLMGHPTEADLNLAFDYAQMEQQMVVDTTQQVTFANRIEYQLLQTQQEFTRINTNYFRWSFLPNVSAFINYNPRYFNNNLIDLYDRAYPTSSVGIQAAIPIFQGSRRIQNLKRAQLQEKRVEVQIENARNTINTEYQAALSDYKSSYNDWLTLRENAEVAKEVYDVIKLQYDEGIKAYIDLITAETDLKAAQLNYINALNRVLASKLDLDRALGNINVK